MLLTLIILYIITLIYISIVERFRNYSSLIAVQGWLLLGIALLRLHTLDWMELSFIITETLIFKALIVPGILMRVIKKTGINRISSTGTSQFNSLMLSIAALTISAILTYYVADQTINMIFFGVALYALLTGLILIVLRSRIFTHMVGFLVIENGVFLFSMAIGVEMPLLINAAIMLDILLSVLMLGLFMTKVDKHIHTDDSDSLTHVKD
jgi:hydrogenase-4 component E